MSSAFTALMANSSFKLVLFIGADKPRVDQPWVSDRLDRKDRRRDTSSPAKSLILGASSIVGLLISTSGFSPSACHILVFGFKKYLTKAAT